MKKTEKYKIELAKYIRKVLIQYIAYTPEKETVVVHHEPHTGELTFWIDGRFRVTISDIFMELKAKKNLTKS